ncbi:unnamed protein product [Brassicogethes aeneus]|uniref:Uncharacterized protein n=1 Tax=Brassicogethes aeneus TaxID=1431903 RepID=A0A9P0FPF2_BRAAE|nr:unnamed protein product [Brassicogethes aeneus]
MNDARNLLQEGIVWKPDGANEVPSRFIPTVFCMVSVARCKYLRMTQFNGAYGCTFCLANGRQTAGSPLQLKYTIECNGEYRTDAEMREQAVTAYNTGVRVKGIIGPNVLKKQKTVKSLKERSAPLIEDDGGNSADKDSDNELDITSLSPQSKKFFKLMKMASEEVLKQSSDLNQPASFMTTKDEKAQIIEEFAIDYKYVSKIARAKTQRHRLNTQFWPQDVMKKLFLRNS